ncbi:hypothetical protein Tco_1036422 [Tanacetum coccineum]
MEVLVSVDGQGFINANDLPTDPLMPDLEDTTNLLNTGIFSGAYDDEDVGAETDLNNLETTMNVSPIPATRIHKDYSKEQIIGDPLLAPQTRRMTKSFQEHAMRDTEEYTPLEHSLAIAPPLHESSHPAHAVLCAGATPFFLGFQCSRADILYLKGQPKLGLWYPMDSLFDLEAFSDSDYARASLDKKSTTGDGISDEFGVKTGSCKVNAARQDLVLLGKKGNADFHQIVDFLNASTIRRAKRGRDTEIHQSSGPLKKVGDEAVYTGEDDRVGLGSGSGPRRQETTLGGADAQTRFETTSKKSHDPPLSEGGHTPGSDEGRPNFNELINLCTQLSNRVLALENSKTAQDLVIQKLKKRVKRLEKALRVRTSGMKLFKIGISRRKGLDKENVSKQRRKSDKTKPMFNDSDFDVLNDSMENVKGGSTYNNPQFSSI